METRWSDNRVCVASSGSLSLGGKRRSQRGTGRVPEHAGEKESKSQLTGFPRDTTFSSTLNRGQLSGVVHARVRTTSFKRAVYKQLI